MKSYTAVDLETLAQGQRVAGDVFRAIFADAGAVAQLARLLQVRELLTPAEPAWPVAAEVPDMDVTWEELARHGEGRSLDPARQTVVERFLGKHFPELPPPAGGGDTCVDFVNNQDTHVDFRPENG
jgi:hypothetical protein